MASPTEQTIVPLRLDAAGSVAPVTEVRSTLMASSILALRELGHFDAYLTKLPRDYHAPVLESVAGSWLPMAVGMAHYSAADALGLSAREQFDIGRSVAARVQNSALGTLVRVAKTAGVTPWVGLARFQQLWDRLLRGGAGSVFRLGPKEARVEIHGVALVAIPYFRNGWRGMFAGSGELFCSKIYVTEMTTRTTPSSMSLRVAWA